MKHPLHGHFDFLGYFRLKKDHVIITYNSAVQRAIRASCRTQQRQ